jgi:hypothetical protein
VIEERLKISVVIPAYNGRDFLAACLESLVAELAALADVDHEVIVVDDGSADGTPSIVRDKFPSCRLMEHERNHGFTAAVNTGIDHSTGDVLFLLNQDTRLRPGCVQHLLSRLMSAADIGAVGPKFVGFDGRLQKCARSFPTYRHVWYDALLLSRLFPGSREFGSWRMSWFDHTTEREVDQPMGAALMIRGSALDEVGMLDDSFAMFFSDVDLCRRLVNAGYRNLYCPGAIVEHHVGGSTSKRPCRWRTASHAGMYRYLRKHSVWYSRPALWLTGMVLWLGLLPSLVGRYFTRQRS